MLKIFTIYSMVILIWGMIACVCKMIKSNKAEERIISFVSLALNCPMLYVLVEILKML
jgi:multisubunit Na+/H+ antiporter MnhF subunit